MSSGAWVTRPDGSQFQQLHTDTYRRVQVPEILPNPDRSSRLEGVLRAHTKEGSMHNTMGQAQLDQGTIHRYETGRQLSESGRSWLITLRSDEGREVVVSRLRSWKEGNGF